MSDQPQSTATELVAGKYRMERLIGRGGMGSVWEGKHATLGTHVAVKFIEAEYVDSVEARQRFENEARAAAMLRSKHVVQVYDHGVMSDGRPYIVMEYLRGEPLDRRLDQAGRLVAVETVRIMSQVCRALAKAHEVGIVHRDLKPENVFLVYDEEDGEYIAKVVDFGIAKFTEASMGVSSSTRTGSVLGTPYYMSPEQARGLRSVDYRSDLWSVGVMTYRCLVGQLPFTGEAVGDLLVKICTAPLPVPSHTLAGIPPSFDLWFQRALAREPHERFRSAAELAEALGHALGVPVRGTGPGSAYDPSRGSAPHLSPAVTPGFAPGMGATTPAPMPGAQPAGSYVPAQPAPNLAPHTAAPFTQTRSPSAKASKGGVIAAAIAFGVVLIVGGLLAFRLLSSAPVATAESDSVPEPKPAASPPPSVAEVQKLEAKPPVEQPAQPPPEPAAPKPLPSASVVVTAKPAPRPLVRRPAPKPAPKPDAPKKPAPIDVGY